MKNLFKKTTLLISSIVFSMAISNAQDVIIKNDKTEIKSKVIKLTETTVKYKKWENQDGPLYNIDLKEINMIVYANGQKEIIKRSKPDSPEESDVAGQSIQTAKKDDKTNIEYMPKATYKTQKVKYKPNRIIVELQSGQSFLATKKISQLSFGVENEFRFVRNIFNLGFGTNIYSTPENDILPYTILFSVYGSFYAPINRLFRNYKKQDKGLFLFVHPGYGWKLIAKNDESGNPIMTTSGSYVWSVGMDYFIFKGFGFTVSTFEIKNYYGGIVYSF